MKYDTPNPESSFPFMVMDASAYSPNKCVFRDDEVGVWLYHANCMEIMDVILNKHPNGIFDMIFADPPYFLSNRGVKKCSSQMARFGCLARITSSIPLGMQCNNWG